jgi:hypothetical protein
MRVTLSIDGSISTSTDPMTTAISSQQFLLSTLSGGPAQNFINTSLGTFSFDIVTSGLSSLRWYAELLVFAGLQSTNPVGSSIHGSITADFENTARLTNIAFFKTQADGSVADISSSITLSAASGGMYPVSVPEPSTLLLISVGLIALTAAARRNATSRRKGW